MKTILEQFREEFPQEEILEAVDIGEGQGDVVPVGIEFREKPDPEKLEHFLTTIKEQMIDEVKGMERNADGFLGTDNEDGSYNQALKEVEQAIITKFGE